MAATSAADAFCAVGGFELAQHRLQALPQRGDGRERWFPRWRRRAADAFAVGWFELARHRFQALRQRGSVVFLDGGDERRGRLLRVGGFELAQHRRQALRQRAECVGIGGFLDGLDQEGRCKHLVVSRRPGSKKSGSSGDNITVRICIIDIIM